MSSDRTTPPQAGDKGLAPCKSPEGIQGDALGAGAGQAPHNAGEAGIAHVQHNGHEDNIAADSTLPVGSRIHAVIRENLTVTRPVMWAGPGSPGSRSERPPAQAGTAGGVPWEAPAEQGAERGATVAGPDQAKQAQPAWGNGTEAFAADRIGREGFAHEGFVNEGVDAEEDAKRASASEGSVTDAAKAACFDTIRAVRQQMKDRLSRRKERKDTNPGESSRTKYTRQIKLLLRRTVDAPLVPGLSSLCVAIAEYGGSASSFNTMRSAAKWWIHGKVEDLLRQQDRLQRESGATEAWVDCVDRLSTAAHILRSLNDLDLDTARTLLALDKVDPQSKSDVVRKAQEGWRETVLQVTASSDKYRHAVVLQSLCGMRPAELELGVRVWRRGPVVGVEIEGAKQRETAGQPWRKLFVQADRFPDWFLQELSRTPKSYSAPADAMRSYLKRQSRKVFPSAAGERQLILSSYVLRHAIATDLRQAGWGRVEIAEVLGERQAATTRWYGLRWRGSRFKREPDVAIERGMAEVAMPVVEKETDFWLEKTAAQKKPKNRPGH